MSNNVLQIEVPEARIREFCKRNYIRSLALFGSVIKEYFDENSDIDILVEFEEGKIPGFSFFAMQEELSEIFGREVDLHTEGFLSPHMRSRVKQEALVFHARH